MQTHDTHDSLFQDEDMLEYWRLNVKYVSTPRAYDVGEHNQRVLAKYEEGDWRTEAQVQVDGEWYVSRRSRLHTPPEGEDEHTATGRVVRRNFGMFTGLSMWARFVLAPVYAFAFAYYCVKGFDVNLQILESED
jgi:hypothetical protein